MTETGAGKMIQIENYIAATASKRLIYAKLGA